MLSFIRDSETVVCHWMDRLGRILDLLRKLVSGLTERGVRIQFIKENLIFRGRGLYARGLNLPYPPTLFPAYEAGTDWGLNDGYI